MVLFILLLYGLTGTRDECILGYYYHSKGSYDDFTMVDIVDVVHHDYIDGMSKIQYKNNGDDTWRDANFDNLVMCKK